MYYLSIIIYVFNFNIINYYLFLISTIFNIYHLSTILLFIYFLNSNIINYYLSVLVF